MKRIMDLTVLACGLIVERDLGFQRDAWKQFEVAE